jgi:CRISPR-associated endonuclease Cas1 subtype II
MGWRTVVISSTAKLDYKMGYLFIRTSGNTVRIHLSEIALLMIESTSVALTAYLLVAMEKEKIDVIFCDEKCNPDGMYISFYGSHDTSQKFRSQITWSSQAKQTIWQHIVIRKITGQAAVLHENNRIKEEEKLMSYLPQVEKGDQTNREGHAAKVYFNALFGMDFSRDDKDNRINAELNYGYSILLSCISREIVSNGYATQLGIFHDNMFNEFNLACDLMEPFRPFVDCMVMKMKHDKFEHDEKMKLISFINHKVMIDEREQYVQAAASIYVKSVLDAINKEDASIMKCPEYELSLYESDGVF